ncbi:MAG: hypothetical protein CL610_26400 [Anaerolineaceae bacterium]|nr:hypothetical protein [Anaerolineaceae bacterium]
MRYKSRSILFVALFAILMLTIPSALAQETFGLSAEDFALFSSPNVDADSLGFDFAVDLNITGAPDESVTMALTGTGVIGMDAAGMPVADVSVTGTSTEAGTSTPVDLQFRLVDGILYMNLGDGSGWIGQPADNMMDSLPVDPTDLGSMSEDPEAMAAMGEMMSALADMEVSQYITISRLDDMNNQAHFQLNVDLSGFLSSDAFTQMMGAAGSMTGDESMAGMGMMMAMMFQNMTLSYDQFVDLADNRIRQGVVDFAMSVDPAMMGASDSDAEPVNIAFTLDVSNLQYDVPVSVTAPEDAMVIPDAASAG